MNFILAHPVLAITGTVTVASLLYIAYAYVRIAILRSKLK
jgi:hypothetical protein